MMRPKSVITANKPLPVLGAFISVRGLVLASLLTALLLGLNPQAKANWGMDAKKWLFGEQSNAQAAQNPSGASIKAVLPAYTYGKPVVLVFKSKYCLDCKILEPRVIKVSQHHPKVAVLFMDLFAPEPAHKAAINLFRPVVTPTVIGLTAQPKQISRQADVLSEAQLETLFKQVEQTP